MEISNHHEEELESDIKIINFYSLKDETFQSSDSHQQEQEKEQFVNHENSNQSMMSPIKIENIFTLKEYSQMLDLDQFIEEKIPTTHDDDDDEPLKPFTQIHMNPTTLNSKQWAHDGPEVVVSFDTKQIGIPNLDSNTSVKCLICSESYCLDKMGLAHFIHHYAPEHFKCQYCSKGFINLKLCLQHEKFEHGHELEGLDEKFKINSIKKGNARTIPSNSLMPCRGLKQTVSLSHFEFSKNVRNGNTMQQRTYKTSDSHSNRRIQSSSQMDQVKKNKQNQTSINKSKKQDKRNTARSASRSSSKTLKSMSKVHTNSRRKLQDNRFSSAFVKNSSRVKKVFDAKTKCLDEKLMMMIQNGCHKICNEDIIKLSQILQPRVILHDFFRS